LNIIPIYRFEKKAKENDGFTFNPDYKHFEKRTIWKLNPVVQQVELPGIGRNRH
jgi:hypothetical protein